MLGRFPENSVWKNSTENFINDGIYGFKLLKGTEGFDSFPSSHAAIAAGLAGALAVIWPDHRRIFFSLAAGLAASRVLIGRHYPSDAVVGFAVGLSAVLFLRVLFALRRIELQPQKESRKNGGGV